MQNFDQISAQQSQLATGSSSFSGSFYPSPVRVPKDQAERERVQIDTRIRELENDIHSLKQRRNALAPAFWLSEDVLLYILQFVLDPDIDDKDDAGFFEIPPHRFRFPLLQRIKAVTHVCSSWRFLALHTPTLWTRIDLTNRDVVAEMVPRSGNLDLDLYLHYSTMHDTDQTQYPELRLGLLDGLHDGLSRTKHLSLSLPNEWYTDEVVKAISAKVTNTLEYLSLGLIDNDRLYLPIGLLPKTAASLRHLSLHLCNFPTGELSSPILFPQLTRLKIFDSADRCANIMDVFVIPVGCKVKIKCWRTDGDLARLVNSIRKFWEKKTKNSFNLQKVIVNPRNFWPLSTPFGTDEVLLRFDASNDSTDTWLLLHLRNSHPSSRSSEALINLFGATPLHQASKLSVNDVSLPETVWECLAKSCPNLTDISLTNDDEPISLLQALHVCPPLVNLQGAPYLCRFLELKSLTFWSLRFGEKSCQKLRRAVRSRYRVGKPLDELGLYTVEDIPRFYVKQLQAYVSGEVDCRGYIESDSEEEGDQEPDGGFRREGGDGGFLRAPLV